MNTDGSGPRRLTYTKGRGDGNSVAGDAAWSPDRRKIAFKTKRDGNWEPHVINADGSGTRNLTRSPARDSFHTWLPDGQIVFASDRDGTSQLYSINARGSGLRNLSREWGSAPTPGPWVVFSPSGGRIAFVSGGRRVALRDACRRQRAEARGTRATGHRPGLSPDGQRIAFEKPLGNWERGSRELFVVNTHASGMRRLTRRPGHDDYPVWSPARPG
jgi:TolB protein